MGGKGGVIKANIQVKGDSLVSTTKHPKTGQEEERTQTIRKLTAQELVLEDSQGLLLKMESAD